jgi:hypothetical protein
MGTILLYHNVRISILSNDHTPPHVHVYRGAAEAKVDIQTRRIHYFLEFTRSDMRKILDFIESREEILMEAWHEIHQNQEKGK